MSRIWGYRLGALEGKGEPLDIGDLSATTGRAVAMMVRQVVGRFTSDVAPNEGSRPCAC